jgi:hypothetical protein
MLPALIGLGLAGADGGARSRNVIPAARRS